MGSIMGSSFVIYISRAQDVSPLQIVHDLFALADKFRRQNHNSVDSAVNDNQSNTDVTAVDPVAPSLFARLFSWK